MKKQKKKKVAVLAALENRNSRVDILLQIVRVMTSSRFKSHALAIVSFSFEGKKNATYPKPMLE